MLSWPGHDEFTKHIPTGATGGTDTADATRGGTL